MGTHTADTEVVRVSQKGQLTVPQSLREKFDIETPGEVFVYDDGGRIVIEPVPSLEEVKRDSRRHRRVGGRTST